MDIKLPPLRELHEFYMQWPEKSVYFSRSKIEPQEPKTWEGTDYEW